MKNTYVLLFLITLLGFTPVAQAGKIKNLNINTTGNAQVNVTNSQGSEVENIKVKKNPGSSVKINGKEVNCDELNSKDGICAPGM